ncbi:MAG: ABC transporter substrate-binding protein [Actinomycetota bacterium]
MRTTPSLRPLLILLVLALVVSACSGTEDADLTEDGSTTEGATADESSAAADDSAQEAPASGDPYRIGWLTDASSVTRGTYFPEFEGAQLFVQQLNQAGGIHGRPIELEMRDMQIDQELAVTLSTELVDSGVLMLAGGTIEGRMPPVFEVVRQAGVPFLTGHSARPDMFPPEPDPLLFTVGNVFEAMSDARVELWPLVFGDEFPDGGTVSCYIHEGPAAFAVCERWLEALEAATAWSAGSVINAPLQTSDFSSFVQPLVDEDPDAFFDISIASHAIGVAVAARNAGYAGPIAFSMTATPETDIQTVVEQVGPDNIWALSNITSIDETDVPEIQQILASAEEFGTEITPNSATVNGWLMGMVIADSLERCGADCDPAGLRDALETLDLDTVGLTGGPLRFSETDHVGPRYWTGYRLNPDTGVLERAIDTWVEFDSATDLLSPLATE